jgi:cytoskeletal protein RodZ
MRKIILIGSAIVALSAAPALAIFGPMPVVDFQSIGKAVEQVQKDEQLVQNTLAQIKNEETNLTKIPTSYQAVQSEVAAVAQTGKAVATEVRGTVAAGTVVQDSSEQAAETARLNGLAAQANGAQQQAIVTNGYLAQQNNLLEQGNVLQAQAQIQHQAEEAATAQGLTNAADDMQRAGQNL